MQTWLFQEVLAYGGGDGTHITDVLHDGSDGYRHDGDDGGDEEGGVHIVEDCQYSLLAAERQADPRGIV